MILQLLLIFKNNLIKIGKSNRIVLYNGWFINNNLFADKVLKFRHNNVLSK